ncbi:hypothetical protein ABPG72_009992 [Tetrahymena utriculariae]
MDQIYQNHLTKCSNHPDRQATHLFVSPAYSFKVFFTCDICTISDEYKDYTKFTLSEIMENKKDCIIKDLPYLQNPITLKVFTERVNQIHPDPLRQQYYKSVEDLIDNYTNNLIEAMQQIKKVFLSQYNQLQSGEFYDFYFQVSQKEKLKSMIQNKEDNIQQKLSSFFFELYLAMTKNQIKFEEKLQILKQVKQKKDITPLKQELELIFNNLKSLVQKLKSEFSEDNSSQNCISQDNQINLQKLEKKLESQDHQTTANQIDLNKEQLKNQNIIERTSDVKQQQQNQTFNDELSKQRQDQTKITNKDQNENIIDNNLLIENKLNILCFLNPKESNDTETLPIQLKENNQLVNQTQQLQQLINNQLLPQVTNNLKLQQNDNQDFKDKSPNGFVITQYKFAKVISKNSTQNNQQISNQNNSKKIEKYNKQENNTEAKQIIIDQQANNKALFDMEQENKLLKNVNQTQKKHLQNLIKMSLKFREQKYLGKFVQQDNYKIISNLKEEESQIGAIDFIINKGMIDQKIYIQFQFQKDSTFQAIGLISQDLAQKSENKIAFLKDCKKQNLLANNGLCSQNFDFTTFRFQSNEFIEITIQQSEIIFYNRVRKQSHSQKLEICDDKHYYLGFILSGISELQLM